MNAARIATANPFLLPFQKACDCDILPGESGKRFLRMFISKVRQLARRDQIKYQAGLRDVPASLIWIKKEVRSFTALSHQRYASRLTNQSVICALSGCGVVPPDAYSGCGVD